MVETLADGQGFPAPYLFRPPLTEAANRTSEPTKTDETIDLYYLQNAEGKLVPVPGIKLEDLDQLLQQQGGVEGPKAEAYQIELLKLDLRAEADAVVGAISLEIEVRENARMRIPLAMANVIVRGELTVQGSEGYALDLEEGKEGYVLFVNAKQGLLQIHVPIKIPWSTPYHSQGFELSLPSSLRSECHFESPPGVAAVFANGRLQPSQPGADRSFKFENLANELDVHWQMPGDLDPANPAILPVTATSEIQIDIVDAKTIRVESEVVLEPDPDEFVHSFYIQLAPTSSLVRAAELRDFVVTPVVDSETKNCQRIEFDAIRKVRSPVKFRLITEHQIGASESQETVIEVPLIPGVLRHTGRIRLTSSGNCQVRWTEGDAVFRVDSPSSPTGDPTEIAWFEFFRQPAKIEFEIAERRASVFVQPTYTIDIQPTSMELRGNLRFSFRGAPVSHVNLNSRGWSIVRVEGGNVSGQASLEPDASGLVRVGFQRPAIGTEVVQFRAIRSPDAIPGAVAIPIPRIEQAQSSPAEIAVVCAESLTLSPVRDRMLDYLPQAPRENLDRSIRDRMPLFYVQRGTGTPNDMIMSIERQARVIIVQGKVRCEVHEANLLVTQELDYDVRNDFLEQIRIRGVPEADALSWKIDDQVPDARLASAPGFARAAWIVRPSRPRQGQFRLTVRFRMPIPISGIGGGTELRIPVFSPMDGSLETMMVEAVTIDPWQIRLVSPAWHLDHPRRLTEWTRIGEIDDPQLVEEIPIQLTRNEPATAEFAESDQFRYQIILGKHQRQDYLKWIVATRQPTLRFHLPTTTYQPNAIQARVNGKPAESRSLNPGELEILLPLARNQERHTVEMIVDLQDRSSPGKQQLELVYPLSKTWGLHWDAELILPFDEKLVATSVGFYEASPTMPSDASGSASGSLAWRANRYILREPGVRNSLEITTATLPWIWFRSALPGLVAAWLTCRFRSWRTPAMVLSSCLVLLAAIFTQPGVIVPVLVSTWGGLALGWLSWWVYSLATLDSPVTSSEVIPHPVAIPLEPRSSAARRLELQGSPAPIIPQEGA